MPFFKHILGGFVRNQWNFIDITIVLYYVGNATYLRAMAESFLKGEIVLVV